MISSSLHKLKLALVQLEFSLTPCLQAWCQLLLAGFLFCACKPLSGSTITIIPWVLLFFGMKGSACLETKGSQVCYVMCAGVIIWRSLFVHQIMSSYICLTCECIESVAPLLLTACKASLLAAALASNNAHACHAFFTTELKQVCQGLPNSLDLSETLHFTNSDPDFACSGCGQHRTAAPAIPVVHCKAHTPIHCFCWGGTQTQGESAGECLSRCGVVSCTINADIICDAMQQPCMACIN